MLRNSSRSAALRNFAAKKTEQFLLDAYPVQCEMSVNGAAAENDFLSCQKRRLSVFLCVDQEAVLFISLMSGSVRTTTIYTGPRLVTPASHYSARVTSRAPPGKVKPPPLTRTQTKTYILALTACYRFCIVCWRD
jgi:hypothetical protein